MSFIAGIVDFDNSWDNSKKTDKAITNLRNCLSRTATKVHVVPNQWGITCSGSPLEYLPKMNRWLSISGHIDSSLKDLDSPDAESLLSNTPLEGEFALCLFDEGASKVILRRDLLGLVPLYYSFSGTKFALGSKIKMVLALIDKTPEVDDDGLAGLLTPFGRANSNLFKTPLKNVYSLEPGHELKLTKSAVKKTKF